MPTEALETILYRDLSKVAENELIQVASSLLRELVNYSTHAYQRCVDATKGEENEDLAVIILYLHIVEMVDGVEVLIAQACPTPAIPLVRSAFEALLAIEYILEKNYVRRSLSWLAVYAHSRIKSYELLDPSTERGKQFQKTKVVDTIVKNIDLSDAATAAHERITNMRRLLNRPQFKDIEAEINNRKGMPNWYQLFGGPANLEQLAQHLNRRAQYDILYRQWSSVSHAQDVSRFIRRIISPDPIIRVLRDPSDLREVANFAATFILAATYLLLGKFRPNEKSSLATWYINEVRERYHFIWPSNS